uniref:Uncharacterized protein n=1 Tax=Tanacetum cinerariifolium TaxID=118510 RepID=A0A6L2JIY3_TANCI|nr:hypothetical protein [Tanacetum cinerariifolium]
MSSSNSNSIKMTFTPNRFLLLRESRSALPISGEDFIDVPDDETALTFLFNLGYKGPLNRHTNMFVDHMHQPWRTLAAIINKCLSEKTASNDKLQKSKIDILWGMFNRENVDYPGLIWEDLAYQIDHMKEKRSRRENMMYPHFTKIIINHFLKQHKSLTNLNHKNYHTIKDDDIVSQLKFVIIGEDYQEYSHPIPDVMLTDAIKHSESYQMFIKYSTHQIPPKKSIGKAEEAEAARKVHAIHARIITGYVYESTKKKSSGKSSKSVVIQDTPSASKSKPATSKTKLKGAPSLTPHKQEAADIMQALGERVPDESTVISATSSKGTGAKPGFLDEDKDITEEKVILEWEDEQDSEFFNDDDDEKDDKYGDVYDEGDDHVSDTQDADDEDVKTESDEDDIYMYKIHVRKDEDEEMKDAEVEGSNKGNEEITDAIKEEAKKTSEVKDDTKNTELPPLSSSLSVSSGFGDQFLKPSSDSSLVIIVKDPTDAYVSSLLDIPIQYETPQIYDTYYLDRTTNNNTIPIPTITTDAPTIITVILESITLSDVELRVAKLEKDESKLKTIDHSSETLAKHMVDLIHKYSLQHLPGLTKKPTPTAKQESEKSPLKILKIKREQAETLIEDENAIDKGVADIVKGHKRKHDDDEDDDDEDPPAGPNQGKKTKRRRTKELEYLKKPSFNKETPKGKALTKGFKTGKSTSAKEPVKEPIVEVIMNDVGDDVFRDDDQPQAASKPKTSKTLNPEWFKQPSRPPTPDPEWNKRQYVLNGHKIENLTQNILLGPAFNLLKGMSFNSIELEYNFQECFNALIDKLDWNNLEGDRYTFDLSNPVPLQGTPGHQTIHADYFFNNDLEYLKTSDPESTIKHAYDKDASMGIKHWVKDANYGTDLSVKKLHGYAHLEEIVVKRFDQQLYKFKEGDFVDLYLNDIEDMLLLVVQQKLFHLDRSDIVDFIVALHMFTRSLILKRRIKDLQLGVERIIYEDLDKQKRVLLADELYKFSDGTLKSVRDEIHHKLREKEIIRNLKRLVGARELEMDYKLMMRIV